MTARSPYDTLVTVYGGSGFLGRHVVRALAKRHYRIRVAVRRPELAGYLQPLGRVGQIHAVQANLRHAPSVEAAARDAHVIVNLVGILFERGRQRFDSVHAYGAEQVALAANAHGARMIHVSAIGADENSASAYARSKAKAEQLVLAAQPSAVVMRPSIMFGPEDDFFNRFASLARLSPGLPLIGGGLTRFSRSSSATWRLQSRMRWMAARGQAPSMNWAGRKCARSSHSCSLYWRRSSANGY